MNESLQRTLYVSRRVEAPTMVVVHALESLLGDGPLTVGADGATLAVELTDTVRGTARGRLGVPGRLGKRVPVELEVEAWSGAACELALRPAGRRLHGDPDRYGEAAGLALERFRDVVVRMLVTPAELDVPETLRRAS